MKTGTPLFDGIAIGELTANLMKGPGVVELSAKAAFVNSKTGRTHGWTSHNTWSPAVVAKLKELTDLMEEEVAQVQFSGYEKGSFGGQSSSTEPRGLADHLGQGEEPPQV